MLCEDDLRPEEDQSIWSKRRQGFQPCCEAGIREPTLSEVIVFIFLKMKYSLDVSCASFRSIHFVQIFGGHR